MALKGVYSYKNIDSTVDYNSRSAKILSRGIYHGGDLVHNGTLTVTIKPFIAHGVDGLVVISDSDVTLPVVSGEISYLICQAMYQLGTDPLIEMRVVSETEWTSSPNKDFFITFAKYNLYPGPFSFVDDATPDYSVSDYVDKAGRNEWRRAGASLAALPLYKNKDGDTRVALDTRIAYTWKSATKAWVPLATKAANVVSLPYLGVTATDVQTAIQQIATQLAVTTLSDRVINTVYADTTATYYLFVPFTRKFLVVPSGINLGAAGSYSLNVASVVLDDLSTNGFVLAITPAAVGLTTIDRTWVTT